MYSYLFIILVSLLNYSFAGDIYSYKDKHSNATVLTNINKGAVTKIATAKEKVEVLDNKWLYKQERQKLLQVELQKEQKLLKSAEQLFNFIVAEKYVIEQKNIAYKELYDSIYSSILIHQKNIQLLKAQLE